MNRLQIIKNHISNTDTNIILLEKKGHVGIIYLNSLKTHNALTTQMRKNISKSLLDYDANSEVKVIVILSKSPKAFCAGADIKEFKDQGSYLKWLSKDIFSDYYSTFGLIKKPIIAGVNGIAFGGGLQTALLCDFVIFSQNAKIGLPEINLGLIPGIGGTQRLAKMIGKNLAMQYILTGDTIDASKLKTFGTVEVLPTDDFDNKILQYAQRVGSKSLTAILTAKMAVNASMDMPIHQGQKFERAIFYPLFSTEGTKQGVSAFIDKRKADFSNK